jgi:hypothetical protein
MSEVIVLARWPWGPWGPGFIPSAVVSGSLQPPVACESAK